jgi:hypothetical protein
MKCPHCGKLIQRRVLSDDEVRDIYELDEPIVQLAEVAGVTRQTIWKIKTRRTYKRVKMRNLG